MRFQELGFKAILLLICMVACMTPVVWAQLYSGSISGLITDPSGAVVPGAKVIFTDVGKQTPFTATTDAGGHYLLRSMPPSTYKMTVEMQGFNTYIQDNVVLLVSQNLNIDVTLKLGTEAQTVEVVASTVSLSTQDAVTGQEVDRTLINDLPLLGRGVYDLVNLSPGVHQVSGGYIGGGVANNFISNGGRNATADILLDGVSTTSPEQNSGIQTPLYTPSVDSVQEFKVQQSNFSADIGFTGATVMNVVTRGGTNTLHGTAYDFIRNNVLTANDWFSNAGGGQLAARRYNDFGATVGGPIIKDKLFFFGSYEGVRDIHAQTYTAGVPSPAEKKGDFGELCTAGFDSTGMCKDATQQLWDPYSGAYDDSLGGALRTKFIPYNNMATYISPGNPKLIGTPGQLPIQAGNLIDPVAFKMMSYFPDPNQNVGSPNYDRYDNWLGNGSDRSNNDQYDIKIDYNISDKSRINGKFSQAYNTTTGGNAFGNVLDATNNGGGIGHTNLFALSYNRTFSPTTLLTVSLGFSRNYSDSKDRMAVANQTASELLGMPSYIDASGIQASPAVRINDYKVAGPLNNIGSQPWGILREAPQTYHLIGSLSKIKGRHDLKFGGEWRVHQNNFVQPGAPAGLFYYYFSGVSRTPQAGSGGDAMASFLTGVGTGWGEYEVPAWLSTTSHQIAGYTQDNWRVNDKLTLNLGIRYDLETPRTERYNRMSYLDPNVKSPLNVPEFPNLTGGLGFPDNNNRHNYGWDKNNWGPRFGFAYKLKEKTVMRGGYGIFYSIPLSTAAGTGGGGYTGFDATTNWITTYNNDGATPWGRIGNPWPYGVTTTPPGSSEGALTQVGNGISGPNRLLTSIPYEQTWSYGFQHELPGQILVDANYVGKKGTHLYFGGAGNYDILGPQIESYNLDQISALNTKVPNPFYGQIPGDRSLGGDTISAYHLMLPYPQFDGFSVIAFPSANSIYHAFQLRVEKRMSHGLQLLANYTFSKSIDDASVAHGGTVWLGGSTSLQDPNKYYLERSLSQYDIPQVLNISYVYQLPIGKGKAIGSGWNSMLDSLLGGWQTNGIWRFSQGFPMGLGLSGGTNLPTYGSQRPSLTGTLTKNDGANWMDQYFANPDAVVTPAPYAIGTAPRVVGSVRTPGIKSANLSLFKNFSLAALREGMALQFRAEFYNAFNTPIFCGPDTTLNGGSFGQVQSTCGPAREVQMALKFIF